MNWNVEGKFTMKIKEHILNIGFYSLYAACTFACVFDGWLSN